MEDSEPDIRMRIEGGIAQMCNELQESLPTSQPDQEQLSLILDKYERQLKLWFDRNKAKPDGFEKTKEHFTDLIVWELFVSETESNSQRELLGLIWQRLEKTIAFKAKPFRNIGVRSSEKDNFDDMMQEAFLRFEDRIRKFDPNNSKTATLKSYVSMVYQKLFINISDLRAVKGFDEDMMPEAPQENQKSSDALLNIEDREAIEIAIDVMKQERPQDTKKFEALRMRVFDGKSNQDVAAELGESESWTSKAVKAMAAKLTEHLSE